MDFYNVTFFKSKPNERRFLVYADSHMQAIISASMVLSREDKESITLSVSSVECDEGIVVMIRLDKDDDAIGLMVSEWKSVFACITQEDVVFEEKDGAWQPDENLQH